MFMVKVRKVGEKRHRLLGRDRATRLLVHAVQFSTLEAAEAAAKDVRDHNPGWEAKTVPWSWRKR